MIGLVRCCFFEHNGLYIRIGALVVSENYRNRAIGKKLMAAAEIWAKENGANTILINSSNREQRTVAHAFYKSIGYEVKSSGFVKYLIEQ